LSLTAIWFGRLAGCCANLSGRVRQKRGKGPEFQHLCYRQISGRIGVYR
jgi:hypothetical protein